MFEQARKFFKNLFNSECSEEGSFSQFWNDTESGEALMESQEKQYKVKKDHKERIVNCFVLDKGTYRVGRHWLCNGFDKDKIAKLCRILTGRPIGGVLIAQLSYCRYRNGDLEIMKIGEVSGIIINKFVSEEYAEFTVKNFCAEVEAAYIAGGE